MRVLVVWEPILATDWMPPSGSTLARIPDARVRQLWDPKHAVAARLNEIVKHKPPQPEPSCCVERGFYWDEAILYPPHARWNDGPASLLWNGPVIRTIPGLERTLNDQPWALRTGESDLRPARNQLSQPPIPTRLSPSSTKQTAYQ